MTNENSEPPAKEPIYVKLLVTTMKMNLTALFTKQSLKSSSKALKVAEQLAEFPEFHGLEDLYNAILNVNDILRDYHLCEPQKQICIDSIFK